jgi:hypothetical protein
MLGEWVLVGTGARRWGFDVIFFFFFLFFFFFFCPFCILPICLGAPFTLFNDILFITYQKNNLMISFSVNAQTMSTLGSRFEVSLGFPSMLKPSFIFLFLFPFMASTSIV